MYNVSLDVSKTDKMMASKISRNCLCALSLCTAQCSPGAANNNNTTITIITTVMIIVIITIIECVCNDGDVPIMLIEVIIGIRF